MQLTRLFVLASAALGAVAQYDDGFNDDVYDDVSFYETDNRPVATVYTGRQGTGKHQDIPDHRCTVLQSPVGGNVGSITVRDRRYCQLYLDNHCNQGWVAGTYFYQGLPRPQNVSPKAKDAHTIKCFYR